MMTKATRIKHHEQDRLDEIDSVQNVIQHTYGTPQSLDPKARAVATEIVDLLHPPLWRKP